ncbi:hypothetical protein [Streptomyces angustmyceticus]|uniref:hypothetical protein n=1 Tax=Streptomyces angustmyceticus TaxID=285578 RepID=UPI001FC9C1DD|nr:hypothetical protein [Streptomyces angustmyceticus]
MDDGKAAGPKLKWWSRPGGTPRTEPSAESGPQPAPPADGTAPGASGAFAAQESEDWIVRPPEPRKDAGPQLPPESPASPATAADAATAEGGAVDGELAASRDAAAEADAAFTVAGHPVAPLPARATGGRLTVLAQPRLAGSSGLLTWFGAPAQRRLTLTVGNLGSAPARDPVFRVGTSHGVFAPQWEEQQWRGTIPAGKKAEVTLPVELPAGAHGDYLVSLGYGGKVLAEQPWGVGRPWGVTLFWVLLCVVLPTAVFRIGMALVDRVRPRRTGGRGHPARHTPATGRARAAGTRPHLRKRTAREGSAVGPGTPGDGAALPWFTPDTAPSTTTSTERPTSKGSA